MNISTIDIILSLSSTFISIVSIIISINTMMINKDIEKKIKTLDEMIYNKNGTQCNTIDIIKRRRGSLGAYRKLKEIEERRNNE